MRTFVGAEEIVHTGWGTLRKMCTAHTVGKVMGIKIGVESKRKGKQWKLKQDYLAPWKGLAQTQHDCHRWIQMMTIDPPYKTRPPVNIS